MTIDGSTRTVTSADSNTPATGARTGRGRRPGRVVTFLAAAIAIAAASYLIDASPGPEPQSGSGTNVPLPGEAGTISRSVAGSVAGAAPDGITDIAPDDRRPLADRLAFWTERVADRPDDFLSLVQLATTEAESARLTVDLGAYQRASALVDRALRILPAYPPTIRVRGALRFALHDFRGALDDANTVLAVSPDDGGALALRGDAALELGDVTTADAAYSRLAILDPGPWLDVRSARLASVRGDAAAALAAARRASRTAATEDPADAGFYAFAVGEYARLAGDAVAAREAFEGALRFRATDLAALVGLAKVDAASGDVPSAIEGLRRASAIAPQPETLILLGDLLASTGDTAGATEQFATVELIDQLGQIDGSVYDRVILRSTLDHDRADVATLSAVEDSVDMRPDSAGYDLLAWAQYRLGRFADAADAIARARASGADDARLRLHDGAIRLALGDRTAGLELIRSALASGPALDPIERSIASALVRDAA